MREIGAFDAKTHLSELLAAAERGESTLITRRGKPVARLVPVEDTAREAAKQAAARIEAYRARTAGYARSQGLPPLTVEEILEMRDEGRR
ncbi:MAG: type II toxin-antitoxin system prevent-host-death family antitoxin [Pseudomonadota bacterium]|nr:type II toxin-antitoxin system prevent-host-death family antitoxin [Pseudomonadota bacterium]MEE3101433.1 type II toxin-antitoxin system prevent-host-death family antitoxin [Pseudomonadota bacterium]